MINLAILWIFSGKVVLRIIQLYLMSGKKLKLIPQRILQRMQQRQTLQLQMIRQAQILQKQMPHQRTKPPTQLQLECFKQPKVRLFPHTQIHLEYCDGLTTDYICFEYSKVIYSTVQKFFDTFPVI